MKQEREKNPQEDFCYTSGVEDRKRERRLSLHFITLRRKRDSDS